MHIKACIQIASIGLVLSLASMTPRISDAQSGGGIDNSALPAFRSYYSPEDYSAYHQIWAITSDRSNRIYVGTAEGVSIYDNASWQLITTPSNTTVRSLDFGFQNQVYVGLQGDIGVISPDSSGSLRYRSLLESNEDVPDFGNVWETHATSDGVYFQSSQYIAFWDGYQVEWLRSEHGYHTSFNLGKNIVVREKSIGLVSVSGTHESVLPGSRFFSDKRVFVFENIGENTWLIGTRDNGFFTIRGTHIEAVTTEIDELVRDHWIYGSIRLSNELIGIYTLGAGLLVIDNAGHLIRSVSTPTEISDRYVISAHLDRSGSLWLGTMNSGIERYRTNLISLSVYDESLGIDGYIYDVKSSKDKLVVSTGSGLHILNNKPNLKGGRQLVHFSRYDNVPIAWESAVIEDVIYVASEAGVYSIDGEEVDSVTEEQSFSIDADTGDKHTLFVGGKGKISILSVDVESGSMSAVIEENVSGDVDIVYWDKTEKRLWANIKNNKIISLELNDTYSDVLSKSEYPYPANDSDVNAIFVIDDTLHYSTRKSIRSYRSSVDAFGESYLCKYVCKDEMMSISVTSGGGLWVVYPDSVISGNIFDEVSAWIRHDDLTFKRTSSGAATLSDDGVFYFSERSKLYRYVPGAPDIENQYEFSVLIKDVRPARTDTVFNGVFSDGGVGIGTHQPNYMVPTIPFDQRDLTFRLTSTDYARSGSIQYQYSYSGSGDSSWVDIEEDTFTLSPPSEGKYALRLRATDQVGRSSKAFTYRFVIQPPWYRTWWAYSGYALLLGFIAFVSSRYVKLRQAQHQAQEQAKELERERVIVRKLQEANERLKEANKLKDEFLATTSHELRTPLTAILGFASVLKEEVPKDAEYREFIDIIEDSGGRLMETLNSLLDLAKIRAGIMDVNNEQVNISDIVVESISGLRDRATAKGLYLRQRNDSGIVTAYADAYALSRIVYNLVSNAIKFTDAGGVEVHVEDDGVHASVIVTDTGVGIDEAFIPHLFDEFIQESDGLARTHEGSGLGLAITGRLVHMMGGKIAVESTKGEGSIFTITLVKSASKRTTSEDRIPAVTQRKVSTDFGVENL